MPKCLSVVPMLLAAAISAGSMCGEARAQGALREAGKPAPALVAAAHNAAAAVVADGQSFADGVRALADRAASLCLFAAWPSATYRSWSLQDVTASRTAAGRSHFGCSERARGRD